MDMLKLVVHIILFIVCGFTVIYDYFKNEIGSRGPWGRFKFFTVWNMWVQMFYFGFCVITDLTEKKSNPPHRSHRAAIQIWRDLFHSCIAFPSAMFVTVIFWVLFKVDRELIWPSEYDKYLPQWLNHLLHTTCLVFIILDKLIVRHHYPSKMTGIYIAGLMTTIYFICVFYIFHTHKFWVYPFLRVLDSQQKAIFIAASFVSSVMFHLFGNWLTLYLWGPGPKSAAKIEKQKGN